MTHKRLSADQIDALGELANIAMGRAASALGQILSLEVELHIPNVKFLSLESLIDHLNSLVQGGGHQLTRQAFSDGLDGEAIVVFEHEQTRGVVAKLVAAGGDGPADAMDANELMLEITNIIVGAFLGSLVEPLGEELYFTPPTVVTSRGVELAVDRGWDTALVLDVKLGTAGITGECQLLLVFPETSMQKIGAAVTRLLDTL